MLVERSELLIQEGLEADFAAAMADKGLPLLASIDGTLKVSLGRGLENPDKFMLLIEWADMDAHMAFTRHPSFDAFRALLFSFTRGGAMEHFNMD